MTKRLTVTADWPHLQPYADEIALHRDCEAAAQKDYDEAQERVRHYERMLVRARTALHDAKVGVDEAEMIFRRVLDEMARPAGYDEAVDDE